ncbi:MAG: RHS repeat-associated core domain-containing protein, partial [Chloroflexia bacterium]
AGAQRVAMRENGTLYWLLADHLGSTAITANGTSGAKVAEVRYKAWGEDRYTYGTTPTTYRYTGQRWEAGIGLYFYNARYYDPLLGRFVQPDLLIKPENPQSLNRFSYTLNNPLRYTDPSGNEATVQETSAYIYWRWGIEIRGENWQVWELDWIIRGLKILTEAVGREAALKDLLGISAGKFVRFERIQDPNGISRSGAFFARGSYEGSVVQFYDQAFAGDQFETRGNPQFTAYTVIHELAHVMDHSHGGTFSKGLWNATEGGKGNTYTEYGKREGEDWPESLAGTLVPDVGRVTEWQENYGPPSPQRQRYVRFFLGRSWYSHHDSWMWRRAPYP